MFHQLVRSQGNCQFRFVRKILLLVKDVNTTSSHVGWTRSSVGSAERGQGEIHAFGPLFSYPKRSTNNLVHVRVLGSHGGFGHQDGASAMDGRHTLRLWIPPWWSVHLSCPCCWASISRPSHLVAIWQRPCPINISLKVSERDKHKMNETYQSAWHTQGEDETTCWDDLDLSEKLPPLKHSETDTDGWEDFDVPILYFYAGLMPYVSQYVSPFIVSVPLPRTHLLSGTCFNGRWPNRTTA